MKIIDTEIPGVKILKPIVHSDERGYFMETWNRKTFESLFSLNAPCFVQDNHSKTASGIVRGLHYQKRKPQGKLVRVVKGEVYDVALDVRKSSPTYGRWTAEYLSSENKKQMWIPPGIAHGFIVTSSFDAEVVFKCTDYYDPESEVYIPWDSTEYNIEWPRIG